MNEELRKIRSWALRGSLQQLYTEMAPKLATRGYLAELQGNRIICSRMRKEGGVLGIGRRTVREPLLEITRVGREVTISDLPRDAQFVGELAGMLGHH